MNELRKALFRALEKSDLNMLRSVLAQGVSLAFEEGDPDPVCFVAMGDFPSDLAVLQLLQAASADLHAREPQYQDSLLHWAVRADDDRLLPWLIDLGLDVNAQNTKGRTPLIFAMPVMMDETDPDDIVLASRDVRVLLAAGASVNLVDTDDWTPLRRAAVWGDADTVGLLLSHGADPQARRIDGCAALHLIGLLETDKIHDLHLTAIDLLLASGADLEAKDDDGWTPLMSTSVHGNLAVFEHLLLRGADPDVNDGHVLRMMMTEGNERLLDRLLDKGIPFDRAHGDEALRPLGLAAHNGFLHGVKVLLDRGADIEAANVDGETALLIATRKREHDVVAHLLSHGANRHHTDHYGNTPLSWAQRRNDTRLIELLSQ